MRSFSATCSLFPFDALIAIAHHLNTRDAFKFSLVCPDFFEAAYHVFDRRHVLDFSPYIVHLTDHEHNSTSVIALTDKDMLQILHAHRRANTVESG